MKIALISDIHANLPALEAVLSDIEARGDVERTYHVGDLVGYAPWPNEVAALLREREIAGVSGNYDSTVGFGYGHCGCKYEDPVQEAHSHVSFTWTSSRASEDTRRFLRALPFRMDLRLEGGHQSGTTLVLVHGAPTLNTLYWTAERSDEFCATMARQAGLRTGDLIAFGHTHVPWQRDVAGIRFINTGSVGRPKDGDWRACYVLVEAGSSLGVEHVRVAYDVDRAAAAILATTLPRDFAAFLRAGGKPPRAA